MLLLTERELSITPELQPAEDAPSLYKDLQRASTPEELAACICAAIKAAGFEWMSYRVAAIRGGIQFGARMFSSHANVRWVKRCREEWNTTLDPLAQLALRSSVPISWSVDEAECWLPSATKSVEEHRYLQLLRGCGIESGVIVELPTGLQPSAHTLFELHSSSRGHGWITENVLAGAVMLGMCVHDMLVARTRAGVFKKIRSISSTQREILRHLGDGRSNKQIAHALQMSGDTVKYHLRELQRHFKARNRMQLINSIAIIDES